MMDFLRYEFLGNAVWRWFFALGVGLATLAVVYLAKGILANRLEALARRFSSDLVGFVAHLVRGIWFIFLLAVAIWTAAGMINLPGRVVSVVRAFAWLVLFFQIAIWGTGLVTYLINRSIKKRLKLDGASATTLSAVGFVIKLALWVVLALLALDNLGINITTLVAGLGIGGIAVALAIQNVLGDLFASLSIVLDKPFALGDFVIVNEYIGTVEHIGLKTTRIRSLSGEQLVFSNNDLLSSRIRNFKRMFERRVVFTFGLVYQTTHEQLAGIGQTVRQIIEKLEKTRFDRAHFKEYGDSALVFEVVYYVQDPSYNVYMDIQQAINLELYRRFQAEGICFAYPTRTLYVCREGPQDPPEKS